MRVALSALSLALAVTQGQAQGLSTYLPSHAFGVSKASWWLSPEVVVVTSAAGLYALRSLVTAFQSSPNIEAHPANKLDYHWENAAPLKLCSKKTFQLSELPSEAGKALAVGKPRLQEQGCYCADVVPTTPEGEASLYFNDDDGQIDPNRSNLTLNGQPTPLVQLKPVLAETPVSGNHLTLSSGMIEGRDPLLNTPVRLDGSPPVGRQVPPEPIDLTTKVANEVADEVADEVAVFVQTQSDPMTHNGAKKLDELINRRTSEIAQRETSRMGIQNVVALVITKAQQILGDRLGVCDGAADTVRLTSNMNTGVVKHD